MLRYVIALLVAVLALAAFVPEAQAQYCYGALPIRLQAGGQGQVTPGLPNILRSQPYRGYDSTVLGEIPAGGVFTIVGGPSCFDGMNWWQVTYNGMYGWTPEAGNNGVYWTQPYSSGGTGCMSVPSRLIAGQYGRVIQNGLPNVLRSQPSRGYGSAVIGNIPSGGVFSVISGPNCGEGISWWQVNYNGLLGWTAEGQGGQYWLEPFGYAPPPVCTTQPPRMWVGYTGVVSSGAPNRLRASASLSGQVLASMSAGEAFLVTGGPNCADGLVWWQVNYRGTAGWTAEGQYGRTFIDPLACPGFQASRLGVGRYARIMPGLPNRLRANASTGSSVLGQIPAGATISVIGGPICGENAAWWRVNYQGRIGWTMEGQYSQYWIEPS